MKKSLNVYFAGELFSSKHLVGNALMAEAIGELSKGRYHCHLPQNLEKQIVDPQRIRDECIQSVLSADVALFNYDGPELDSGTVVEYLFAKFADIPAVLLRTDFRSGGDQETAPWNLMNSFFPRTEVVVLNAMTHYKEALELHPPEEKRNSSSASRMIRRVAEEVIGAMDRVTQSAPVMPESMQKTIFNWLTLMPGLARSDTIIKILEKKMDAKCTAC